MVWQRARRVAGFAAVGAVLAGTAVAARPDPDTGATAVHSTAETAWLPDGPHRRLVLADAGHTRALTAVSAVTVGSAMTVVQAGRSAVAVGEDAVLVVSGETWQATEVPKPVVAGAFVAAGPGAAWLLSPRADTARRIDLDARPATLGPPVRVGAGLTPGDARVTDDGTLWVLGSHELRGVADGRDPVVVPLDESPVPRALTLVDGDPVVLDARRARHIDRARAAVDRDWPVGLPDGPVTAAERSDGSALARAGDRLSVSRPDRSPVTADLGPGAGEAQPVMRNGLVHVPHQAAHAILAIDPAPPAGPRLVRRIPLPGRGTIALFGHHGRVWYVQSGSDGADDQSGVITDGLAARPVGADGPGGDTDSATHGRAPGPGPAGNGAGRGAGGNDDVAIAGPADPSRPAPPQIRPGTGPPPIATAATPCARTWTAVRCLPDDQIRPGARTAGSGDPVGCPHAWVPADCVPGGPAGGPEPTVPRGPDGNGGPAPTPVAARPGLPAVAGLDPGGAGDALAAAGLTIEDRRDVPSLLEKGTVVGVRHAGHRLAPGAYIEAGWPVILEISDGTKPATAMAINYDHGCVVTEDQLPYCWGQNLYGQLGNDATTGSAQPVPVTGLTSVRTVTVGPDHSCALRWDHTVWCWGHNDRGQLGDGGTQDSLVPRQVLRLDDVEQIAGQCARRGGGAVWCWGTRVPGPDGKFVAAPSGPVPVAGIAGATYIGASCAVVGGDTARCWGLNNAGQLGNGLAEVAELPPVAVKAGPPDGPDLRGVEEIRTSLFNTCARMADATVRCWGARPGGPFTVTDPIYLDWAWPTPVAALEGVQQLAMGDTHGCALVTGGTVRCWGSVMLDEQDSGAWVEVPVLVPGISTAVSVYAGGDVSCAILDDGSLQCWGQLPTDGPWSPWVYTPIRIKVG
jgi:hypothetical protein